MGYTTHHSIVVTAGETYIKELHEEARHICGHLVSGIVNSKMNGHHSFFVATDGSKEGWPDSAEGDSRREELKKYLRTQRRSCDWVEVVFGGDGGEADIVDDGDS